MRKKDSNIFDLPALLRLEYLDIRGTAQKNLSLTVDKYYSLLSRYKKDGPKAADALQKIASNAANKNDYQAVISIKTILDDIGCRKFGLVIDDIVTAVQKNNPVFAADCAKSILNDFNKLYSLIIATEKTEGLGSILTSESQTQESETQLFLAQTLQRALVKLDREEANRKMRILAVDDSPLIIKNISSILDYRYTIYGMTNPMMLEKFLEQIVPELFLLDYKMPERTGFELIPIIRSFDEHKKTPIVILTSMGTVDHISASHSLGACDFIVKPIQDNILREKVAKHIVRKKSF
ncbi:MAG: response regulator [Treponema sp.]|nr:response regulator [Treponema sp.]